MDVPAADPLRARLNFLEAAVNRLKGRASLTTKTVAVVTAANTPYTALPSDDLIEMESGSTGGPPGVLVAVKFEASPAKGTSHTVKWWSYTTAGDPPPAVNGNGKQVEAYDTQSGISALGPTTNITTAGGYATWVYDGTDWVLCR